MGGDDRLVQASNPAAPMTRLLFRLSPAHLRPPTVNRTPPETPNTRRALWGRDPPPASNTKVRRRSSGGAGGEAPAPVLRSCSQAGRELGDC